VKYAGRTLLAVLAGMALAFVLVVGVEFFSSIVHPLPPDFNGNMPEHVRRYQHWVLAIVVLAWGATSGVATWTASKLSDRLAGIVVGFLLEWALVFNLTKLPYVTWFKIAMFVAFPIACLLGIRYGAERRG
jgi:uncharacterized membrane protein